MKQNDDNLLLSLIEDSIEVGEKSITVTDVEKLKKNIHRLTKAAALDTEHHQAIASYLIRGAAQEVGITPASIQDFYLARGKGEVPTNFTVPAINLRILPFDAARAAFRVAKRMDAGALIFEIARSEIGYTDQRPSEYAAHVLAAAIAEDFKGPVFLQGDHFQISASRYAKNAEQEVQTIKALIKETILAGFFNIDIDTSTLVNLDKTTITEQQTVNFRLSAELAAFIRSLEPDGLTVSIGGEIGEVGGHNSTEEELSAYTKGFNTRLEEIAPDTPGLSKISVQTGTSHGGVVLPDGSIAQVDVDFDTLYKLGQLARNEFGLGGVVQHGASTLPQDAFGKFVEAEACEIHLATNFQNIFFNHVPDQLRADIYTYLDENHQHERKPDLTDDQFYYKTRKRAIGPFKKNIWDLPQDIRDTMSEAWEKNFQDLFTALEIAGTNQYIKQTITAPKFLPSITTYLTAVAGEEIHEDITDLAD